MQLNDHLIGKEQLIRFSVHVFLECLSVCVYASFSFGFEDGMWDLIVLILEHFLSFYIVVYVDVQT